MEACTRHYAEQTWGAWDGRADLDPAFDKVIQLRSTGLIPDTLDRADT
jgi:hypothetical protein